MCISRLISSVLADTSCEAREESEKNKMKIFLSTVELDPTFSRLLDWHSN